MGWKTTWATATRRCPPARPDLAARGPLADLSPAKAETGARAAGPLNNSAPPGTTCRRRLSPSCSSAARLLASTAGSPPPTTSRVGADAGIRQRAGRSGRPPQATTADTWPGFATQARRSRRPGAHTQQAQIQPRQHGAHCPPGHPPRPTTAPAVGWRQVARVVERTQRGPKSSTARRTGVRKQKTPDPWGSAAVHLMPTKSGRREWTRTIDPHHVKVVL